MAQLKNLIVSGAARFLNEIHGNLKGTADNASSVNGFTVGVSVPASAKFTDTTYANVTSAAAGLAPAGGSGTTKYLRQDGSWQVPPNTTYANVTSAAAGLAPAGGSGTTKYLRQDGSWQVPPNDNTTYGVVSTAANGLAPKVTDTSKFLKGDGTWATPTNTTYTNVTSAAAGLAPAGGSGTTKYLRQDGSWQVPPNDNTTYGNMTSATAGLAPAGGSGTTKYLRQDGSWQVPPNTTYADMTTAEYNTGTSTTTRVLSPKRLKEIFGLATASSATNAASASYATSAGTADSATSATNAGSATNAATANYAKSASTASRLANTAKIGDTNKPVYFKADGTPATISYTIDKSVPSNAVFTDTKVTQTNDDDTDADYRILFSSTVGGTTLTEYAKKSSQLIYNPNKCALTVGERKPISYGIVGNYSIALGRNNIASSSYSYAEGLQNTASGVYSHAEGFNNIAGGEYSHAEGINNIASGNRSHAEGGASTASGEYSHVEGSNNAASGINSHAEGYNSLASGNYSHAEGYNNAASGYASHAEGNHNTASGINSHAEGASNIASGNYSHAEGYNNAASGIYSHVEGGNNIASSSYSHAEGLGSTVSGLYSHAEGHDNTVSGSNSHAEGASNTVSGDLSHAEGWNNIVSGNYSHAEGCSSTASGYYSHAEGYYTLSSSSYSHAEGRESTASGVCSHAEGCGNIASGKFSHAEGCCTTATHKSQHVFGEYNIIDASTADSTERGTYVEIVGSGIDANNKSNARTLDWDGNEWLAGGLLTNANIYRKSDSMTLNQTSYNNVDGDTTFGVFSSDSENKYVGGCIVSGYNSGRTATRIVCRNMTTAGNYISNYLNIGVEKNGDPYYKIGDAPTFRTAIGVLNTVTNLSKDVSTVSSGTSYGSLYSFTMQPGTYILNITVVWATNATGRRAVGLSTNTSSTNQGYHMVDVLNAVNGTKTYCHMTQSMVVSTATTYYVLGYQNSGASIGAEVRVNYIRLNN